MDQYGAGSDLQTIQNMTLQEQINKHYSKTVRNSIQNHEELAASFNEKKNSIFVPHMHQQRNEENIKS